jgi:hypothetical protein
MEKKLKSLEGQTLYVNEIRTDITGWHLSEDSPPQIHLKTSVKNYVFDSEGELDTWLKKYGPLCPTSELPKRNGSAILPAKSLPNVGDGKHSVVVRNR